MSFKSESYRMIMLFNRKTKLKQLKRFFEIQKVIKTHLIIVRRRKLFISRKQTLVILSPQTYILQLIQVQLQTKSTWI